MKPQIVVHREVTQPLHDGDILCLQEVTYQYQDGNSDTGIRFIRRGTAGNMKAQRGQANLVSLAMIRHMVRNAESAWADVGGEK